MNIHEYQAKAVLAQVRRRRWRTGCRPSRPRKPSRPRDEARRPGLGRQGADPRRRPRQGRRRQGRRSRSRTSRRRRRACSADAGDAPDRPEGQGRQPHLRRAGLGDREGVLSLDAGRPRDLARRDRRLDRGRHGHREGRARHAGEDRDHHGRSGDQHPAASRAPARQGARPRRAISPSRWARCSSKLYQAFVETDMSLLEINPLVDHQGQASCSASTPRSTSTTTRSTATRTSRRCAT